MSLLFTDFASWQAHCATTGEPLYQPVLAYEIEQKGRTEEEIWAVLDPDSPITPQYVFADIVSRRAQIGWATHGHSGMASTSSYC